MPNDWITMETLGTFGGVVFVVTLICQFLKGPLDSLVRIPTRLLVLVVAWAVLLGSRWATSGELPGGGAFLDLLNGFLVALAAIGTHAVAKDTLKWK